ncbi:MAG: 3'-5' exoribonuclease [Sulfurimonas sp.]|nr:3'-5' exoribonuclease [Sulfurimonas sp.]
MNHKMNHIMMDIETLSTDSNGAILSIDAVLFSLQTGSLGKMFTVFIDIKEQVKEGAVLDRETFNWWSRPENVPTFDRLVASKKLGVRDALVSFNNWIKSLDIEVNNVKLWGNGSGFDNVLVRNLYKRSGIEFIIPFWCDNDVRTLVTIANLDTRDFKFEGIKHNGVDDCKHQINYCHTAYKLLR